MKRKPFGFTLIELLVVIATEESADMWHNQPNPADDARDGDGAGGD